MKCPLEKEKEFGSSMSKTNRDILRAVEMERIAKHIDGLYTESGEIAVLEEDSTHNSTVRA
jgi:hypothetical protein